MKPLIQDEIISIFGNPAPYIQADGTVSPDWERCILAYGRLPAPLPLPWDRSRMVTRFRAHKLLVKRFESAFTRIHARPEVWATINDFGGIYLFRTMRGSRTKLSTHCWGISADIDTVDNPQGEPGQVHPFTIESFAAEGFLYGGDFSGDRRDPMHFEFAMRSMLEPCPRT